MAYRVETVSLQQPTKVTTGPAVLVYDKEDLGYAIQDIRSGKLKEKYLLLEKSLSDEYLKHHSACSGGLFSAIGGLGISVVTGNGAGLLTSAAGIVKNGQWRGLTKDPFDRLYYAHVARRQDPWVYGDGRVGFLYSF